MIPGKRPLRFGESVRRKLLGAAVLATVPACALAQTSGSWTFNGDGSWSESAKWNPVMPNGGGVAVLGQHRFQNIGHNVTLDIPVTLDSLVFDSPYRYTIASTSTNTLTLTGSAIINTIRSDTTA